MVKFKKRLIVFGGGSNYDHEVRLRKKFNDLYIFDTCKFVLTKEKLVWDSFETPIASGNRRSADPGPSKENATQRVHDRLLHDSVRGCD